jgi:hypothetical protein
MLRFGLRITSSYSLTHFVQLQLLRSKIPQMSSQNPVREGALGAVTALSLVAALISYPAAATSLFDGMWHVSIVTNKGECPSAHRLPVRIASGVVSSADMGLVVSGRVSESGQVTVVVAQGNRSAAGSGRLSGRSGSGKWIGDSCSGTWSAQRGPNGRIVLFQ